MRFGNCNVSHIKMSVLLITFSRASAMRALGLVALLEAKWDKVGSESRIIILFFFNRGVNIVT